MTREPVYSGDEGEYVTIRTKVYEELLEDQGLLIALQNAGVDNWDGYSVALAEFNEEDR